MPGREWEQHRVELGTDTHIHPCSWAWGTDGIGEGRGAGPVQWDAGL